MAHTYGTNSARTSSTGNPITTAAFTVDALDTVLVLMLKVNGATNRAGGAPVFGGFTMVQAATTQKAATSPEASCELWYLTAKECGVKGLPVGAWTCVIPNTGALTVFYRIATGRAKAGGSSRIDVASGSNGTSTNPASGGGASNVSEDGEIGFAVVASGATTWAPSAQSGTVIANTDDGAHGGGEGYWLQSSAGLNYFTWTFATSDDWGAVSAFFREVPPPVLNNYMGVRTNGGMGTTEKIR